MRLPKATDADKQARRAAIDEAMKGATETPLETMRACQQAMRGATIVAEAGNPNAASDAGVAVELLLAALRGAALNIGVNLKGLSDAGFAARVSEEATQLEADAVADAERARQLLAAAG
jgi:formiminotetrahydrofolate cyclodeaminase